MTAFFSSSVVTWCSALLDGKILDLVCSGDSTQPSKVIQGGGLCEGRLSPYLVTFSATHFVMSATSMNMLLLVGQKKTYLPVGCTS